MADFNQFGGSDEENVEIKKLLQDVVWNSTPSLEYLCLDS